MKGRRSDSPDKLTTDLPTPPSTSHADLCFLQLCSLTTLEQSLQARLTELRCSNVYAFSFKLSPEFVSHIDRYEAIYRHGTSKQSNPHCPRVVHHLYVRHNNMNPYTFTTLSHAINIVSKYVHDEQGRAAFCTAPPRILRSAFDISRMQNSMAP